MKTELSIRTHEAKEGGQIIEEILLHAQKIEDARFGNVDFILHYGSKKLIVGYSTEHNDWFTTELSTEDESAKLKNETTLLYTAAKHIMQRVVNELHKEREYRLITANERMKLWAETTGNEIFQWHHVGEGEIIPEHTNFETTFKPANTGPR